MEYHYTKCNKSKQIGEKMAQLDGIRVVEFSHMVMGPTVGMILADLGADVVKVEPVGGDKTRRLPGSGAGYHGHAAGAAARHCVQRRDAPRGYRPRRQPDVHLGTRRHGPDSGPSRVCKFTGLGDVPDPSRRGGLRALQ